VIENSGLSAANGSALGPAEWTAAAVMPPVQAGMLPSAFPARSAPIGVRIVPSLAASSRETAARPLGKNAATPNAQISIRKRTQRRADTIGSRMLVGATILACALAHVETASSEVLWSDGDASVRLDTTVQFTGLRRLSAPQSRLLANPNADDGDRDFSSGNVSNRTDVFSELDADYGAAGVRLSGAGWYDPVYLSPNANDSPATFNPISVPHDRFTQAVRSLEGVDAELLDGFVHDTFDIGDTQVGVRLGRYTLIWGESLFFGENGIAAGQAPIDFIKADTVPETPARELFLPVNQISGSVQLRPGLSVEVYDQLEWRHDRLPGVGSYFSTTDILGAGGERIIAAPGQFLYRTPDQQPGAWGQFGAALHATVGDADLGFYALRYNACSPVVTNAAPPPATCRARSAPIAWCMRAASTCSARTRPPSSVTTTSPARFRSAKARHCWLARTSVRRPCRAATRRMARSRSSPNGRRVRFGTR
jgi:hypothetical protein